MKPLQPTIREGDLQPNPSLPPAAAARAAEILIEERLRAGRPVRFTITSTSMWPALQRGDQIVVQAVEHAALRLGDIVFVRSGKIWLAHRLIGRRGPARQIVTKGDNSTRADEAWPAEKLVGRVIARSQDGREASLRSAPARRLGAGVALLSRAQGALWRQRPEMLRHALLVALGAGTRFAGGLGRTVSRFGSRSVLE